MIEIKGLTKYYNEFKAVDAISFEVKKGEIVGLLGPNGAGKTTTIRILTGYLAPTAGTVKINNLNIQDDILEIKRLIGYLPESAPLYDDMLVYDYLDYIAEIRSIEKNKRNTRIHELAEMCGLQGIMHKAIHELSKGLKQRVGLAHAMISDPEILILDEPTSGLDPNQIIEIRELIKRIGKKKTVILSSHILSEVEATCSRVVIINSGKIVADGGIEKVKKLSLNKNTIRLELGNAKIREAEKEFSKIAGVTNIIKSPESGKTLLLTIELESNEDLRGEVYKTIKKQKEWILLGLSQETKTLEDTFRELTK